MPAGLGASGWMAIAYETTMGTYVPPTTAGTVWVPILSESLAYNEDAYYSEQIRQEVGDIDRQQGYYHVEGDVQLEFDANSTPLLLYCSRHNIVAVNETGPVYEYAFTPSTAAQATTDKPTVTAAKSCSLTVVRNGIGFGYAGCTMNTIEATIDGGVLKMTFGVLGLSEQQPGGLGTPAWANPSLMGASAHAISVDAAGLTPAFASPSVDFNGFTANINHNGTAQNRIVRSRAATYVSYAKSEVTYNTELDFVSRAEYDNMVNNTRRAIRLESIKGGATYTLATEAFRLTMYNTAYETYPVNLSGMSDLIMASVTGRALRMAGGSRYKIETKGPYKASLPT